MNCHWIDDQPPDASGVRTVRCARCDNRAVTADPVERITATCRQKCRYQGIETRRIPCPGCRGNVEVKVLACELHDECTPRAHFPDMPNCTCCSDFSPVPTQTPAAPASSCNARTTPASADASRLHQAPR